jgi:predicted nucleic acid-binding protein
VVAPLDDDHSACLQVARSAEPPLVSTWPCFTEAMFLARRDIGWAGQKSLWQMLERATLLLIDLDIDARVRSEALMSKYSDLPMSLADASLVAVAEKLQLHTVFTLDSHFSVYRLDGRRQFHLVP